VRAKAELEAQIHDNQEQAIRHEKDLDLCDLDLKSKNEEMRTIETYLQSQIDTLKKENTQLSELLEDKTKSLAKEKEDHSNINRALASEVQSLKDKLANARDDLERDSKKSGSVTIKLFRNWKTSGRSTNSRSNSCNPRYRGWNKKTSKKTV
jgi:chromosome segregation ATPase